MPTSNDVEYDDDEFVDEDEDGQEEQPVRQQANPLRKTVKQLEKQLKALQEENATLKASTRSRTLADVFAQKGVPQERAAKLAAFYPQDADSSPEAIGKWLEDNADVFGVDLGGADEGEEPDEATAGLQRVQQASQRSKAAPTDLSGLREALRSAKSQEELANIMKQLGGA